MSDQLFNIRFGKYHWQVTNDNRWSFRKNDYWDFAQYPSWFEVYCLFGKHFN